MQTTTKTRAVTVPCLKCGEVGSVMLNLFDVDTFGCTECNDEFTREDVEEAMAKWSKVLAWIDAAPIDAE